MAAEWLKLAEAPVDWCAAMVVPKSPGTVPELTRSAGIQLNERVSLRRSASAVAYLHRILLPPSGPSMAKPSGDYTPLGGFVLHRSAVARARRISWVFE